MHHSRFFVSAASALAILAGGAFLSSPASAATTASCSSSQITYVRGEITDVCGSRGGTAIVVCDGASIEFQSITCGAT